MTQHFDSSVLKVTTEGDRVLSSVLDDGERLAVDVDQENRQAHIDRGEDVPQPTAEAASTEHDALGIEPEQDPTSTDESAPALTPATPFGSENAHTEDASNEDASENPAE